MGTYNQYGVGTAYTTSDVVANESYAGAVGAFQMIEEASCNEHAIFEAVIGVDFMEAYSKINPAIVSESEFEAVSESTVKNIWTKVKEFVVNIGEKILGIIKGIKDRIMAMVTRDGKELVRKFEKQVNEKFYTGKLEKMKFKYAKPKTFEVTLEAALTGGTLHTFLNKWTNLVDLADKDKDVQAKMNRSKEYYAGAAASTAYTGPDQLTGDFKPFKDEEKVDMLNDAFSKIVSGSDAKSFAKDFDEKYFDAVEEKEGLTKEILNEAIENLNSAKKSLKAIEKNETATKKTISELKKKAETVERDTLKKIREGNSKVANARKNSIASKTIAALSIYSNVAGKFYAAVNAATKKEIKQSRAIFVKAATFNGKSSVDEQSTLLEAVVEASDYEVDAMFDLV